MADPEIWMDPDPPEAGKALKVGYTGQLPVELEVTWIPPGEPTSVTITNTPQGWAQITVPDNATGVNFHDPTGAAQDQSRVVT